MNGWELLELAGAAVVFFATLKLLVSITESAILKRLKARCKCGHTNEWHLNGGHCWASDDVLTGHAFCACPRFHPVRKEGGHHEAPRRNRPSP